MQRFVLKFLVLLNSKQRKRQLNKRDSDQVRESCLRLLARREHSEQELYNKLALKGFSSELIKHVIDEMQANDWQSNQRFADSYVRNRIRNGYGPVKIDHELRHRGIEYTEKDHIVAELIGSWAELIEQVYTRKYTDSGQLTRKEWAKRARFLRQRGFTIEMIRAFFEHSKFSLS